MSSACSVPWWLRWLVPEEPSEAAFCCVTHDESYKRGGTQEERRIADEIFYVCLVAAGFALAWAYYYTRKDKSR